MASFSHIFAVLAWFAFLHGSEVAASNSSLVPFRIMPLGASVTFGVGSTTGDSYRKDLEDLLLANGNTVTYVGTNKNGNFTDNAVEAVSGFVISQISALANTAVPQLKPNLVLLDAGTNNCNQGGTVPDAGANVTSLINNIFQQSPGATVILTTILVNPAAAQDACRVTVNEQYTALANKIQSIGAKLILVDMRSLAGPLVTDLADGRHSNDAGYVKMANVWFSGIQEVISKGMIVKPSTNATAVVGSTGNVAKSSTTSARASQTSSTLVTTPSPVKGSGTRAVGTGGREAGLRVGMGFMVAAAGI